jgi:3-hydroxybutyryl-CoA dehydrogenase
MLSSNLKIEKIGVIGAGTMGNGIAHVSALSGFDTVLVDVKDEFVQRGFDTIQKNMDRQVKKEKISQSELETSMNRITLSTDYNQLSACDLIIEAATESKKIKLNIFKELDNVCNPKTILVSNTSSISINKIASFTSRPEKVIGMHFMNPVPIMKLVEVVLGHLTSEETIKKIYSLAEAMGKHAIKCNDYPGFVSNRILAPMINEAIFCLMEGVAEKEAIDDVMRLGMAHPMGPLRLADLIGLDICLSILEVLHHDFGDDKYRPCPLLRRMVSAGCLGRKTGEGFYEYS